MRAYKVMTSRVGFEKGYSWSIYADIDEAFKEMKRMIAHPFFEGDLFRLDVVEAEICRKCNHLVEVNEECLTCDHLQADAMAEARERREMTDGYQEGD